jgi:hypothetical protein
MCILAVNAHRFNALQGKKLVLARSGTRGLSTSGPEVDRAGALRHFQPRRTTLLAWGASGRAICSREKMVRHNAARHEWTVSC